MYKIEIVFTSRKSFSLFGWLIKKVLGTKYSHVLIRLDLRKLERSIGFQASAFGVEAINNYEYTENFKVIHSKELEIDQKSALAIRQFCLDNLHRGYGWKTIITIACKKIFGRWCPFGRDGNQTFICSEFVAAALKHSIPDLHDKFGKDLDTMDPKQLYELIRSI